MKIAIIGAGASGIIAALRASINHQVYLIDSNDKCGKKLLATGAGHCNYWNQLINESKYQTDNYDNLLKIISKTNQDKVLNYLDSLGIYPRIKNGYYYPYSNQATSIRQIFETALNHSPNITCLYNHQVTNIIMKNQAFTITTDKQELIVDKVIISTGSKAYPKTGSAGAGYDFATKFGHTINPVLPALTKLITSDESIKDWENIRTDATIKLYVNNIHYQTETGEIQLTKDGISGICTFNLSSIASKNLYYHNNVTVRINFLPHIENIYQFFEERSNKLPNKTLEEILESIFNYKLLFVLLKHANIKKESLWNELSEDAKTRLIDTIGHFELPIVKTDTFDKSQICTGGVSLSEINPETMESTLIPNLYFTGEILDVDGKCGGYNLALAFITGYLAGSDHFD